MGKKNGKRSHSGGPARGGANKVRETRVVTFTEKPQKSHNKKRKAPQGGSSSMKTSSVMQSAPQASARMVRQGKPSIYTTKTGCRITHKEYFSDVTISQSVFGIQAFPIQPGLANMFPWLSVIARRFDSYKFRKLKIWYLTECATDTFGAGYAALTVDYDPADPAPVSKMAAMSYEETVRGAPWEEFCHVSKPSNLHKFKEFFTRGSALQPNLDIKTYDVGNLYFVSGNSTTANQSVGELWVEYDIELITPSLTIEDVLVGGAITSGGFLSSTNPLGTLSFVDPQAVGLTVDAASVFTLLQAGTYQWSGFVLGTGITGINLATVIGTVTYSLIGSVFNAAGTSATRYGSITVTSPTAQIYLTASATTVTQCGMLVSRAPVGSLN